MYGGWESIGLVISGVVDYEAVRDRLEKEVARVKADIEKILNKINNREFVSRAPEAVVLENRARHAELLERMKKLETNLNQLPS